MTNEIPFLELPRRQRARNDDAKYMRRNELIAAARRKLVAVGYDEFTMAELAAEAKVAKGTAYLYFSTREELLLTVLTDDLHAAFEGLQTELMDKQRSVTPAVVGAAFYRNMSRRPTTLPLLQVLHTKLERNVSASALQVFKVFLRQGALATALAIEERLNLVPGHGARLFVHAHALAIGLYQMADRPDAVQRLFEAQPELAMMPAGFEAEYITAVTSLATAASVGPTALAA